MLFEAGENFMNIDEIFTYYPNTKIRTETYYIINNILTKEYRYNLETNNLGLPQNKDFVYDENIKYELFLGASYMEGQGSPPWFNKLYDRLDNTTYSNLLMNTGILGTGPEQWAALEKYLRTNITLNLKKSISYYCPLKSQDLFGISLKIKLYV